MGLGNLGDLGNLDLGQLQQLLPNVNFPPVKTRCSRTSRATMPHKR
jgi:hypothetical protein